MLKNIKRIGKKTYKFQVDVFFEKVEVNIKFPCQLFIIWKRGPRKQETKPVNMDIPSGSATFNEYLQMGATLFQDVKTKKYQEKKTSFTIVISTPKGNKVAGACELDLGSYPNQGILERKEVLGLKKSPDPNAKLHVMIKVALISEADNMSVLSGITEQDSFDEAGSNEASQLDYDTSRIKGPSQSGPRQNMDNILDGISSKSQLQQEIRDAPFKQRVEEEDEEYEESPKKLVLTQINPLKKSQTDVTTSSTASTIGRDISPGPSVPASGEAKKPAGFNKLFEKKDSEASSRVQSKLQHSSTTANAEKRGLSQEKPRDTEQEVKRNGETKPSYQDDYDDHRQTQSRNRDQAGESNDREVQSLRDEVARKQNEFNKMKAFADQLKRENQELKQSGANYESASDEVLELRDRINEKNNEISEQNKRNEELQQNIEELKQTIYKLNKEKGQETRGITQEMEKLKNQIRQVEQEKGQLQQENHNLNSKISKMQNDFRNLMSDFNALKQENASNRELYENTRREKEDVSESTQSYEIELKRYKDRALNMDQEIQRLREQVKEVQTEKEGFQRKGMEMSNLFKEKMRAAEEENTSLRNRFQELEKTYRELVNKSENTILDLKKQLKEADAKKEDALSKQTQLAIDLQNLRINFEKVNSELEYKNETYSNKTKDLDTIRESSEKENTKLREKLATMESQFKTKEIEYQQKFEQLKESAKKSQTACEEAVAENERLKSSLKTREHETSMQSATYSSDIEKVKEGYKGELEMMKQNLELRDTALNNLKKENKSLFNQVEELKKRNADLEVKASDESRPSSTQVVELQNQFRLTESNWQNQIKELKDQNDKLKKQLSTIQKHNEASQDVEKQVGQLSIENETLKKQVRDLTAKASNTQSTASNHQAKENEELKKKEKEFKKTITKLEEDLLETKTKLSKLEGKTQEDEELIVKLNKKVAKTQESVSVMETELVKTKQKMGEIMNVIMESAESDLVDRVNSVVYENNY